MSVKVSFNQNLKSIEKQLNKWTTDSDRHQKTNWLNTALHYIILFISFFHLKLWLKNFFANKTSLFGSNQSTKTTQKMSNEIIDSPEDKKTYFRFEAELTEPKKLIPMLRAIDIMKTCVLTIDSKGIKFSCQDLGKCLQANSFIHRSVVTLFFDPYLTRTSGQP